MKVVAASDSHGRYILDDILKWEPDADLYLHCGDLEEDPRTYPQWLFVKGNNDWMYEMPMQRVIPYEGIRILMVHGHAFPFRGRQNAIADLAVREGCQLALYGHTHVHDDQMIEGVRVVNPGSAWMSRDGRPASYAVITVDNGIMDVELKFEDSWPREEKEKKRRFWR